MEIRAERPTDAAAISLVTVAAFREAPQNGQAEARIIEGLRAGGALTVALVAAEAGDIVGHVAFSPVTVATARGAWYGLGPVAVRPDRQRQGIGQALIGAGIRRLSLLQAAGCVVLGDPRYYRRFGFESDPALTYGGKPSPYFQRLILNGPPACGEVAYHSAFEV
jgi:predicted N-acetyltransferase YhbS